jgi:transposase
MTEPDRSDLRERLVIGRKSDGRRQYDEAAREELVRRCLKPGVSVARLAIEHDLNPNLLRKWIGLYQQRQRVQAQQARDAVSVDGVRVPRAAPAVPAVAVSAAPAFIPVMPAPASVGLPVSAAPLAMALQVRLPNGVELELGAAGLEQLTTIVQMLGRLSCSASTTG